MIEKQLRRAYLFFRNQGVPAQGALSLAKGERTAEENDWLYSWEPDDEGAADWYCARGCQPEEVLSCFLRDESGEVLASLHSIGDPSQDYARVVEAELATEAMQELERTKSHGKDAVVSAVQS